ncbi:MAG TPA: ABC transporter permease [Candidatus Polarisedimenticolia bacterium]|nr:ABC transporter permease [Candidatus Polarisedimenticolia bacterium]
MFGENLAIAFRALWANKMRSLLTTLGVVIGVAAVIAVVSIVQGFFFAVNNLFKDLGSGWVRVIAQQPDDPEWEGRALRALYRDDAEYLKDHAPLVRDVAPGMFGSLTIKNGDRRSTTTILGTVPGYMDIVSFYVDRGRFFTAIDDRQRRKVCAIGAKVIEKLEIDEPVVGRQIQIGADSFTIVGVMEARGELIGLSLDDYIFIPFGTAKGIFGEESPNNTFWEVAVSEPEKMELAKTQIIDALRRCRRLKSGDPDDFRLFTQEQFTSLLGSISKYATGVAGGIAGVALFVGGIGIMNIMLVSVTERTREIGVRKAVGARRGNILLQFLIEATILTVLGGGIGIALGVGIGFGVASLIPNFPTAHVPIWAVVAGFSVSGFVGVVFGVYPALRAAQLDPIESLRYE